MAAGFNEVATAAKRRRIELQIGDSVELGAGETIAVTNPASEEVIAEVRSASSDQVDRAVLAAHALWRGRKLGDADSRSAALNRLADVIEAHGDEVLETVISEVGTPITTARPLHLGGPVAALRYFAEAALVDRTEYLGRAAGPPASDVKVLQQPVGVVAGITAYNYPLLFAALKAGAAFAAGCPSVLLPSPQAPLSTLLFAGFVVEAGWPDGALSVLAGGAGVAQELVAHQLVTKVSFTGSVPVGTAIMKAAADGLRGVVLELGGKSAALLLPGADIGQIATPVHHRYLRNAGQGCASPTRILVHESQFDDLAAASRAVFSDVVVGDPLDERTLVGPVISSAHQARVTGYVSRALHDGGAVLAESTLPSSGRGWYAKPTLLGGLANDREINQQEVFGPVASVQAYRSVDEAIAIANDTTFGLHASVYGPVEDALAIADRLDAGTVTINGGGGIRPDAPSGGWRHSGIGRELGEAGIREFLEPVTVQWPACLHGKGEPDGAR